MPLHIQLPTSVFLLLILPFAACAATFEVGPGKPLADPAQVPWESLAAGDTVLIHWRTNAYLSKWVLCRQGTEAAPIIIRGVPGPQGQLPIIDGNGATTRSVLNYWNQPRGVIKIGGASLPPDTTPSFITIENLDIRSGRPPYSFTAANGTLTAYPNNAASIYIEKGQKITVRNCILHDSGNGLFVAAASREVLIQGNHLYDNGNDGSLYEHNSYTAAIGITFEFNRYGPLRTGALGNNLKDRSAGLIVRYNWIESGNRQLDLVDGEDDPLIQTDPRYRQTFVYGNILIEPDAAGNRQIVHYGGDSGNTAIYRKGTLFFYNNTILSTRTDRTTLFRLSTNEEQCDCRNNLVLVTAAGSTLSMVDDTGKLLLSHNWFKAGWVQSFGAANGSITNDGSNLTGSTPGFLHEATQNFRLASSSPCIDAGTNQHPSATTSNAVTREYNKHLGNAARRQDARIDIGAYEFSPWHSWRFNLFGPDYSTLAAAQPDADLDGDGIPTLLEYALSLDPITASQNGIPSAVIVLSGNTQFGGIRFPRRLPPSELIYTVQTSTNLLHWHSGCSWSDDTATLSTSETITSLDGPVTIVRLNTPLTSNHAAYLKLSVSQR